MTKKITDRLLDKFGNNAVFACSACEKPYLTTGILRRGRACPHCGKSCAFIAKNGENPDVVMEPQRGLSQYARRAARSQGRGPP
jgi:hypothetical protein